MQFQISRKMMQHRMNLTSSFSHFRADGTKYLALEMTLNNPPHFCALTN